MSELEGLPKDGRKTTESLLETRPADPEKAGVPAPNAATCWWKAVRSWPGRKLQIVKMVNGQQSDVDAMWSGFQSNSIMVL